MSLLARISLITLIVSVGIIAYLFLKPEGTSWSGSRTFREVMAVPFKPLLNAFVKEEATSSTIEAKPVSETTVEPVSQSPIENVPTRSNGSHVLISEIQYAGDGTSTTHDFIELYNPLGTSVDISGWKLHKRTQSGTESSVNVFEKGASIPAYGYFLWANSNNGYATSLQADESSSATLAANNSIALEDADQNVIDAFAWGSGLTNPFVEGAALTAILKPNQSFERKEWQGMCVSASQASGNGCDFGNNSFDFDVNNSSDPRHA